MSRRRRTEPGIVNAQPHVPVDLGWHRSSGCMVNGRHLSPGVEFSVRGERGRFRFQEHVLTPDGREWIHAIGGATGVVMFRAFRPDRVRRVHRIAKTRHNAREVS